MLVRNCRLVCLMAALAAVSLPAMGAPSGLNIIPTADVLDQGIMSLEVEGIGRNVLWGRDCEDYALFQLGLGSGLEAGLDICLDDISDYWFNIKWRFREEVGNLPAVALGVQSVTSGERAQVYAVATKSLDKTRFHVGVISIDSKNRLMFGIDHAINDMFTFQADYVSGSENSATLGIAANLTDSLSLTLARNIGNSGSTDNGYILNLAWSKPIK